MARKIAAGNWKMNGGKADLPELAAIAKASETAQCDVVICPPAPLLFHAAEQTGATPTAIGAQDCHSQNSGAFTGDISAPMIADSGARYVIVGHSERREGYNERNADIRSKAEAAHAAGLCAIICLGETLEEREANTTLEIIGAQLSGSLPDAIDGTNTVIAYEPVWAIGTGKIPTLEQIIEVHDFLRSELRQRFGAQLADEISLLYGGSVKAGNAAEIFTARNVDGALVGGASLKAADFAPIIQALSES